KPTADLLTFLDRARRFVERTDLKYIRVVPALAECRVAEDEPERLIHREQPLLFPHDQVVHVVIGLRISPSVLENTLLVPGEVPIVETRQRFLQPRDVLEGRELGQRQQLVFEHSGKLARNGVTLPVVVAVVRNTVDEEERQDFDSWFPQHEGRGNLSF